MTDEQTALIARIEAATGADGAIDNTIEWEVGDWVNLGGWWVQQKTTGVRERRYYTPAPAYTGSLDAAVSLVPDGWGVIEMSLDTKWLVVLRHDRKRRKCGADHKLLIAALCLAALKARWAA